MRSIAGIFLAAGALTVRAEPPKVNALFPAGGQNGTACDVAVAGQFEPWPLAALCDDPRIVFTPDEKEKGRYRVTIDAAAEPGARLVRFHSREGAAAPRIFVVGTEVERLRSGSETMALAVADLPLTVNGKLEPANDVARFVLELEAGQVLVAEVASSALDAPLDPLLHLFGPNGGQVAFNHDASRASIDPRLVFGVPATGRYELHLSAFAYPPQANIRFAGGAEAIFRLTLRQGKPAFDLPPPVEAAGEEPQPLALPATVSGRIDPAGDIDRFRFEAGNGESLRFEVAAEAIGSWMDPVLVIEDTQGGELKRQDDIDSNAALDVILDWSAPAAGTYLAKVLDLNGSGGSDVAYRFQVSKPAPAPAATAAGGVYAIRPGENVEIAVTVQRLHGFAGELEVGADALPPGLTAAPVAVSEKGEAKLVLEAAADAPPVNAPCHLWVAPTAAPPEQRVPCRFALKGANADAGRLLVNETPVGWLTVLEKK